MKTRTLRAGILAVLLTVMTCSSTWGAPPAPVITTPTPQPTSTPRPLTLAERLALTPEAQRQIHQLFLPQIAQAPQTEANPASFTYVVKADDTLWSLALDFGRDLDTMSCTTTPTGADAEKLVPGRTIVVPALNDLCYTVRPGDSLRGIAARGDARPRADRATVSRPTDQWGGTAYEDWPYGDGQFAWPVTGGWISQGAHAGHIALDIAIPSGSNVRAADRGKVIMAGWNPTGYGFRVVIDHGTDYVTLYAHLSDIYVEAGEVVGEGQVIGLSGANGNITGPHLHFEVRDFGRLIDPLRVLPK